MPGEHSKRLPCLVDVKAVMALDQALAIENTDDPLQIGFLYLVAIMDLHSRAVISSKLPNSLNTDFCLGCPMSIRLNDEAKSWSKARDQPLD